MSTQIQDFATIPLPALKTAAAALKFTIAETQHAILRHGSEGNVKAVDMLEAQLQEYKKAAFEIVSAPVFQKEVEL